LTPEQWRRWKHLEGQIATRDTGKINIVLVGNQHRKSGTAGATNPWGRAEGHIGNTIDYCVDLGIFTKAQIATLAGTRLSKINSHIQDLRRGGHSVAVDADGIVRFEERPILAVQAGRNLSAPEELGGKVEYREGAVTRIWVNAYERSREARRKCIEHYGCTCWVCEFDFGERYGHEARGFIHVHHLVPLSEVNDEYVVDPIEDLRPVCPNCHSFIHMNGGCRDVEILKGVLKGSTRS
jgi:hypothetical protein